MPLPSKDRTQYAEKERATIAKMIRAVIFDLDGTLADTIDDIGYSINQMLALHSFPLLDRNGHLGNINHGAVELVRRSLPANKQSDAELVALCLKEYESFYSVHHMCDTVLYDGIHAALSELSADGILLAVLSNKQDGYVKDIISALFGDIDFKAVCGMSDLPAKPDPSSALKIAEKLCLKPDEIAFVGDSHVDMQTARNAGMYPIGVSWGYRSKQILLENGALTICETPSDISALPRILNS